MARVKELTGGLGAHSVIEAVGTQESMMQAIRSTRPGGHDGFVGVLHDVAIPGEEYLRAVASSSARSCGVTSIEKGLLFGIASPPSGGKR